MQIMQILIRRMMLVAMIVALACAGCQHTCQKRCLPAPPPGVTGTAFLVPPVDRGVPSGPVFSPQPLPQGLLPAVGADARGYAPPALVPSQPTWGPPTSSGARLLAPEIPTPEPPLSKPNAKMPDANLPATPKPSTGDPASAAPALPEEIPGFAPVKDQVSAGQRPFQGGFDWLKRNGYSAVLYIHEPGEDESADKRQADERGLKFLALQVSPQTLGRQTVADFKRMVADPANRPLFVYARNNALGGALWYLYFRTAERLSDEEARSKAAALGLKTDSQSVNQPLWLAIQKYLSEAGQ